MHTARTRVASLVLLLLAAAAAPLALADSAPRAPEWMAGEWSGTAGGLEMEELWTSAKGGAMLGLHRDVRSGKITSFEFLRIEVTPDTVTYWAMPQGRPATPFRLVENESGPRRVVFANPRHDFPTRILYWISEDGLLHARTEGTLKGKAASEEWSWRRER
jgi:hypothetical protein